MTDAILVAIPAATLFLGGMVCGLSLAIRLEIKELRRG